MSDWDAASTKMDEDVDAHLSDTILYSTSAGVFEEIPGYILPFAEGLALGPVDGALGSRWRVKIAKAHIEEPSRNHRLRHPKLGDDAVWRPAGENPDDQGRYWIFDIQKVDD